MPPRKRIAVFASGGGTNLQSLVDHFNDGGHERDAHVALVVGSRAGIGAVRRAEAAGVTAVVLDTREIGTPALAREMIRVLRAAAIDLVVLAGYLQLIPAEVVKAYHGRIINIHPALLPAFGGAGMYGRRVHEAVIAAGARVSGATVHFVDERYDEGRIIAQWPVPVLPGDTPEVLAARVLAVEHRLLPAAVEALLAEQPGGAIAEPVAFELVHRPAPEQHSLRAFVAAED